MRFWVTVHLTGGMGVFWSVGGGRGPQGVRAEASGIQPGSPGGFPQLVPGVPSVPMMHRSIRSIGFVFEDPSLGTDVKQVPDVAVLNFDFVIPFAIPFRFENMTRRITGFDCFQYRPR